MRISAIVAMGKNRVIGINNQLPWHLPADLKFFKARTMGKPVIMGRKTFESIGRPLPGRINIVITRNEKWMAQGVLVAHNFRDALHIAEQERVDEVMVIGGAQIYEQALPLADRLYITEVDIMPEGDAWFPKVTQKFKETSRNTFPAEGDKPAYSFVVYDSV